MQQASDIAFADRSKRGGNQSSAHTKLVNDCCLAISKVPGATAFRTNASAGGMVHLRGLPPGWPDITVLFDGGRVAFVECKTGGARLSATQRNFLVVAEARGAHVYECHFAWEAAECVEKELSKREWTK